MGLARLALVLTLGIGGVSQEGYAARYAPGVMQKVVRARGIAPELCMVALTSARHITGRQWVLVQGQRTGAAQWCLVVDLPQDGDRAGLIGRGVVTEVDYASGILVCGKGWTGRARDCKVRVWVLDRRIRSGA